MDVIWNIFIVSLNDLRLRFFCSLDPIYSSVTTNQTRSYEGKGEFFQFIGAISQISLSRD